MLYLLIFAIVVACFFIGTTLGLARKLEKTKDAAAGRISLLEAQAERIEQQGDEARELAATRAKALETCQAETKRLQGELDAMTNSRDNWERLAGEGERIINETQAELDALKNHPEKSVERDAKGHFVRRGN